MMVSTPAFVTDSLGFSHLESAPLCLRDLSLTLPSGRFYGLIGPNGSGKSTLLDLLSGYHSPRSGTIQLFGEELSQYRRKNLALTLATVPQSFNLSFDYTVEQVVMMGRHAYIPRFAAPGADDRRQVEEALETMGIGGLRHRSVSKLSGGEKQRVMLARALSQDTPILLLDEVTANLDINHAIAIMKTLARLVREKARTIIAALHDLNMAAAFCDRLIVLKQGQCVQAGATSEILTSTLIADLYGVTARIAVDDQDKKQIQYSYQ